MSIVWSKIAGAIMALFGWHVVGSVPNINKYEIVAAHHTSNWDGLLLVLASFVLKIRVHWMVKHTLMKPPLGWLLRALGGISINRTASHGAVEQMVDEFNRHDKMILILSPEGTRKKVSRWKRGFYHIAKGANVPMVLAAPDYKRKQVIIGPMLVPSGDLEADLVPMRAFFSDKTPRHPEKAGEIVVAADVRQPNAASE
jgi:1-acyl-sn-glycerol-3-phosphate acyltransferase